MKAIYAYPTLWIEGITAHKWTGPLLIAIVGVLVIFPTLSASGLEDWDEGIYAVVARNAYRTGDFIHLKLGDNPYLRKPPLYIILTSGAYALFGINEFAVRFTSAIFGVGGILMGYALTARLLGRAPAMLTAIFLLADVQYMRIIQHGRMESMAIFFIITALYAMIRCREDARWIYLFSTATALAVLSKGAMGLFPFIICAAYVWSDKDIISRVTAWHLAAASALFLFISLPWFLLQYLAYGQAYLNEFIKHQTIERIQRPIEGHAGSPLFYIYNIAFSGLRPWAFLSPLAALLVIWDTVRRRSRDLVFMSAYMLIPLGLFSLGVKTKLPWYGFVMYLPLAIATVYLIERLPSKTGLAMRGIVVAASLAAILAFNWTGTPHETSLRSIAPALRAELRPTDTLVAYNLYFQSLNFYSDRNVSVLKSKNKMVAAMQENDGKYFILKADDFMEMADGIPVSIIARTDDHVFFRTSKAGYNG